MRLEHKSKPSTVVYAVRIPARFVSCVKRDAVLFKKNAGGIAASIFERHFMLETETRAKVYAWLPDRRLGRKVAT